MQLKVDVKGRVVDMARKGSEYIVAVVVVQKLIWALRHSPGAVG